MTLADRSTDRVPTDALPIQTGPRPGTPLPIDTAPAAEAPAPVTRRDLRGARLRRWRSRFVLLLVLLAIAAVAAHQIVQRLERADQIALQGVQLSADPVDVVSRSAGRMIDIPVRPGQSVRAGDVLATTDVYRPDPAGGERLQREPLVAPVDGVVATIPTDVGAALGPGEVAMQLYQPERLRFETEMDVEQASFLRAGGTGLLSSPSTADVPVRVASVEPSLRETADEGPRARVTFVATDLGAVRSLLPGLTFTGWVEKGPVPRSAGS